MDPFYHQIGRRSRAPGDPGRNRNRNRFRRRPPHFLRRTFLIRTVAPGWRARSPCAATRGSKRKDPDEREEERPRPDNRRHAGSFVPRPGSPSGRDLACGSWRRPVARLRRCPGLTAGSRFVALAIPVSAAFPPRGGKPASCGTAKHRRPRKPA